MFTGGMGFLTHGHIGWGPDCVNPSWAFEPKDPGSCLDLGDVSSKTLLKMFRRKASCLGRRACTPREANQCVWVNSVKAVMLEEDHGLSLMSLEI